MSRPNKWLKLFPKTKKVGIATYHLVKYNCCEIKKWVKASEITRKNGKLICRNCSVKNRWINHKTLMTKYSSEKRDINGNRVIYCKECKAKLDETNIHKNTFIISGQNFGRCKSCALLKRNSWRNKDVDALTAKKSRVTYWQKWLLRGAKRKRANKSPVPVSIDESWILKQFQKQKKKCYWTGVKLEISNIPNHPFKPSLDRLEVNGPYSPQNTVISALSVNIGRNENSIKSLKTFLKLISQS